MDKMVENFSQELENRDRTEGQKTITEIKNMLEKKLIIDKMMKNTSVN